MADAEIPSRMRVRVVAFLVTATLVAAALFTFHTVHHFGQTRFFTIDEWQYGHATWLVTQGQRPYVDFYEHHFPASYVAHAALLPGEGSFEDRALLLRKFASTEAIAVFVLAGLTIYAVTRNRYLALCSSFLPLAFGFGLMSQIDYRADNFAAVTMLACVLLLEANRGRRRRGGACACGVLFAVAVLSTQKMVVMGGVLMALLLARDFAARFRKSGEEAPLVAHPAVFVLSAAAVFGGALAAAAATGILAAGFETTILHAIRHEEFYPESAGVSFGTYARPFFAETAATTIPILAFAAFHLVRERPRFWGMVAVAALATASIGVTRYPYNFVLLGWVLVLCAVRGYGALAERVAATLRRIGRPALAPLLYLAPLALLPDQLAFVANTTSNAHQLHILRKIEQHTGPDDVVIDSAGGALFRPHASYYWLHGDAHRVMFHDYFANELIEDYRRSAAIFWIRDFRLEKLPEAIQLYFRDHYTHVDGDLFGLGLTVPKTRDAEREVEFEVIRAGEYLFNTIFRPGERHVLNALDGRVEIDAHPLVGGRMTLAVGVHRMRVAPGSPAFQLSILPPSAFESRLRERTPHSPLFEYDLGKS